MTKTTESTAPTTREELNKPADVLLFLHSDVADALAYIKSKEASFTKAQAAELTGVKRSLREALARIGQVRVSIRRSTSDDCNRAENVCEDCRS